jgi:hypothetical protein
MSAYFWYVPNVFRVVTPLTIILPLNFVEKNMPPVAAINWVQVVGGRSIDLTKLTDFASSNAENK